VVEAGELSGGFNPSGQIRLSSAIIIIIINNNIILILVVIVIVIVIMPFLRLNKTNMC